MKISKQFLCIDHFIHFHNQFPCHCIDIVGKFDAGHSRGLKG